MVLYSSTQGFEMDGCQSKWYVMLNNYCLIVFYKFYEFFCRRLPLINRPCYNKFFQFMQHDNFWHLNRVIFTHWKHLESRVNAFWYCFSLFQSLNNIPFTIWWNRPPFQETRALVKYSNCLIHGVIVWYMALLFDTWRYQSLMILFLVLFWF